jgi:hypothetical protein
MVREFHGGDEMTKKSKRFKKATKSSKRSKIAMKPVKRTKAAPKSAPPVAPVTRSSSARASIAEGTRLYAPAGRPSKADFIKVYGPSGPKMTWAQRAEAGVDAKHLQAALAAKGGA